MKRENAGRLLPVIVPVLAIGAGPLFLFSEPVRRFLVAAVVRAVWIFRVASLAIGQVVPWAVLVAVFAVASFAALKGDRGIRRKGFRRSGHSGPSRAALWDSRIDRGCWNGYIRRHLETELRRLATEVLAHAEGLETAEVPGFLARAGADVPEAVQRLFAAEEQRYEVRTGFSVRRRPARRKEKAENAAAYGRWISDVVGFLEERMGDAGGNAH